MQGYQFNPAKFTGTDTEVFGISTDNTPSQRRFSEDPKAAFDMLSDFRAQEVTALYGVLNKDSGVANRTTFVVDKNGRIQHLEEGAAAVDVLGAAEACARIHKQ